MRGKKLGVAATRRSKAVGVARIPRFLDMEMSDKSVPVLCCGMAKKGWTGVGIKAETLPKGIEMPRANDKH